MRTVSLRRRVVVPAVLASLVAATPAQAPASDPGNARRELAARIGQDLEALASHSRGLRSTPFRPQDVVAAAGREPVELFDWVRRQTRWVPYRGCLRGARGVLADGTGNSLDRALLLAELLRCAGIEARLARASIDAAEVAPMAAQWAAVAGAARPDEVAPELDRDDEDALALVAATVPRLLAACGDAPAVARVDVAAALQDHWWVRYRDGDDWRDLDLMAEAAGQALAEPADTIAPTARGFAVGAADAHVVALRVVIEQTVGQERAEHTVLSADLRPADWFAAPVELSFHAFAWPAGLTLDGSPAALAAFRDALLAQKEWMPILRLGEERVARVSFDATGTVDEHPALDGRAKVGRAVGRGFEALGNLGDEERGPAGLLTALWLEFEVQVPGSAPERRRHEVFDLLGPAAREAGELPQQLAVAQLLDRALALSSATEILPLGGHVPGALAVRVDLEQKLELRPRARALAGVEAPDVFRDAYRELAIAALAQSPTLAWATLRGGLGAVGSQLYLDRPNLVCARGQTVWDGTGAPRTRILIDVLANDVAVVPGRDEREARLRQGAIDTVAEELALGQAAGDSANTMAVFVRTAAHGIEVRTLRDVDDLAAIAPAWPADAVARARADLLAGNVLLAAAGPVPIDGAPQLGWWRVDPRSGSSVGVMASGFHQDAAEYETTAVTSPLQNARRLLEFLAKRGNAGRIYRARNGSRIVGNLAEEWQIITQIQQRAAQALYEGFGTIAL